MFTLILIWLHFLSIHASGTSFEATESKSVSNKTMLILTTESDSQIGCFMKVNFQKNPCRILEVRQTRTEKWTCWVLVTTENLSDLKLVNDEKSTIYTAHRRIEKCSPQTNVLPQQPPATSCLDHYHQEVRSDGVYDIHVNGKVVSVFCDMTTDGGGWTVFQKRVDGTVDFYRVWDDYVKGFGDPNTNYWLGLEVIHQLTSRDSSTRFMMKGIGADGKAKQLITQRFSVGAASTNYVLNTGTEYTANNCASYKFTMQNGMQFSTYDRDNDMMSHNNCASSFKSGWWYYSDCDISIHPNGVYGATGDTGIRWEADNEQKIAMALRKE